MRIFDSRANASILRSVTVWQIHQKSILKSNVKTKTRLWAVFISSLHKIGATLKAISLSAISPKTRLSSICFSLKAVLRCVTDEKLLFKPVQRCTYGAVGVDDSIHCRIILKCCTVHDSLTVLLQVKFQPDPLMLHDSSAGDIIVKC